MVYTCSYYKRRGLSPFSRPGCNKLENIFISEILSHHRERLNYYRKTTFHFCSNNRLPKGRNVRRYVSLHILPYNPYYHLSILLDEVCIGMTSPYGLFHGVSLVQQLILFLVRSVADCAKCGGKLYITTPCPQRNNALIEPAGRSRQQAAAGSASA